MNDSGPVAVTRPAVPDVRINPQIRIDMVQIDQDHVCACIDDFLLEPESLVGFAARNVDQFTMQERAYPGRVLPVFDGWLQPVYRFIRTEMARLFSFCRGGIEFHTQLSLTTLQPEDFTWIQRLCHSDPRLGPGRRNFAALLYLFDRPEMGGTGFYRWRDPEYWQKMTALQVDDPSAGLDELEQRFEMFRQPPGYMTESNEAAELLQMAPARFNRLIFYPGDIPHNAYITRPDLLSDDPASGRLTLNCFVDAIPRK